MVYHIQVYGFVRFNALGNLFVTIIRTVAILSSHYNYFPFPDTYHSHTNTQISAIALISIYTEYTPSQKKTQYKIVQMLL